MASPPSAGDLNDEICNLLYANSIVPINLTIRHLDNSPELTSRFILLARSWLIAKGVPETQAYKASPYVLVNAFKGGDRYIAKMLQDANPAPKRTRNSGFRGVDLSIDLDAPIDPKAKPDDRLSPLLLSPLTEPTSDNQSQLAISPSEIARAAEKVLGTAIERYKRETQSALLSAASTIQTNLGNAVDRRWTEAERHFAERTKELVSETQAMVLDLAARQLPRQIVVRTPTATRTLPTEIRHEAFDRILRWLLVGENVAIVGPAGTGKTHMAKQLAEAIDKKLYLPGQALSKYDISGYKGPTGEYFGTVVRDALEQGGLLFVDEGDMWAAAAFGFLNAPLANGFCAFPDKTIEVHPDFQCIVAMNTYGRGATQEYIGRNPLDAASVDRFAFEFVDHDEDMERLLYGNSPWLQYVHRVRHAVQSLRLRHVISQRAIRRILRGLDGGLTPEQVCFSSLWRGLDTDTIQKIKAQAGEPPRVLTVVPDEDETDLNGTNS